ncbi:MAG: DNA cytosine methyltransferase [Thermoplasmatales archaeon]
MKEYTVMHLFSGLGGAALGFQAAMAEYRGMVGRFRTVVGIDVDPEACADFRALTRAPAVEMDLFTRAQYIAFHGRTPPEGWREAAPADLLATTGGEYPDVVFTSPPCKAFSGLLPSARAASDKYQALNGLVTRGIRLVLEAFTDNLPAVIMIENVPRITSRGAGLLADVKRLLGRQGYVFSEGYHDCGEIGGLGQHRRRYLLIARLPAKVPGFIYRPFTRRVRSIGEVIGHLPMPDDPAMGPLHRLPRLSKRTWIRLALIPAGGDWRDLQTIAPEDYRLLYVPRGGGPFGVQDWAKPGATVTGAASVKGSNAACVADLRLPDRDSRHPGVYRVVRWEEPGPCVTGSRFGSGAPAIADPRLSAGIGRNFAGSPGLYGVLDWNEPAQAIIAGARVSSSNCPAAVADPRIRCEARNGLYGVQAWEQPGSTVTGARSVHSGTAAVADPRAPLMGDADDRSGVWVIISEDGTWHRPLTTLELAALQGLPLTMPDGRPLVLAGRSDARWRERIGNAVPPPAARGIADEILLSLLANERGDFRLSDTDVWVLPGTLEKRERGWERYE